MVDSKVCLSVRGGPGGGRLSVSGRNALGRASGICALGGLGQTLEKVLEPISPSR